MSDENKTLAQEVPYPFQAHLGFKITEWQSDFCRLEIPLEPFLMNRYGIPHGGLHATLLDTVMGYSCCYTDDPAHPKFVATLSLNVQYLAQSEGRCLYAEGRRTGGGRKTSFAEGRVTDDTWLLVSTGTAVFKHLTNQINLNTTMRTV